MPSLDVVEALYDSVLDAQLVPIHVRANLKERIDINKKWEIVTVYKSMIKNEVSTNNANFGARDAELLRHLQFSRFPNLSKLMQLKSRLCTCNKKWMDQFIENRGIEVLEGAMSDRLSQVPMKELDAAILFELIGCAKLIMNSASTMENFISTPAAIETIVYCLNFNFKVLALQVLEVLSVLCDYSEYASGLVLKGLRYLSKTRREAPGALLLVAVLEEEVDIKAGVLQFINNLIAGLQDFDVRMSFRNDLKVLKFEKICGSVVAMLNETGNDADAETEDKDETASSSKLHDMRKELRSVLRQKVIKLGNREDRLKAHLTGTVSTRSMIMDNAIFDNTKSPSDSENTANGLVAPQLGVMSGRCQSVGTMHITASCLGSSSQRRAKPVSYLYTLNGEKLQWWSDNKIGSKPTGSIDIEDILEVHNFSALSTDSNTLQTTFDIISPTGSWTLLCPSEAEKDCWVTALLVARERSTIKKCSYNLQLTPLDEEERQKHTDMFQKLVQVYQIIASEDHMSAVTESGVDLSDPNQLSTFLYTMLSNIGLGNKYISLLQELLFVPSEAIIGESIWDNIINTCRKIRSQKNATGEVTEINLDTLSIENCLDLIRQNEMAKKKYAHINNLTVELAKKDVQIERLRRELAHATVHSASDARRLSRGISLSHSRHNSSENENNRYTYAGNRSGNDSPAPSFRVRSTISRSISGRSGFEISNPLLATDSDTNTDIKKGVIPNQDNFLSLGMIRNGHILGNDSSRCNTETEDLSLSNMSVLTTQLHDGGTAAGLPSGMRKVAYSTTIMKSSSTMSTMVPGLQELSSGRDRKRVTIAATQEHAEEDLWFRPNAAMKSRDVELPLETDGQASVTVAGDLIGDLLVMPATASGAVNNNSNNNNNTVKTTSPPALQVAVTHPKNRVPHPPSLPPNDQIAADIVRLASLKAAEEVAVDSSNRTATASPPTAYVLPFTWDPATSLKPARLTGKNPIPTPPELPEDAYLLISFSLKLSKSLLSKSSDDESLLPLLKRVNSVDIIDTQPSRFSATPPTAPSAPRLPPLPPGTATVASTFHSSWTELPNKKKKLKKLFWNKMKNHEVSHTIWGALKNIQKLDFDHNKLEQLFSEKDALSGTAKKTILPQDSISSIASTKDIALIDKTRAQNILIALKRLKLTPEKSIDIITGLDPEILTLETTEILLQILPTAEENDIIRSYEGDVQSLGLPEKLFTVFQSIPRLPERLRCHAMIFGWDENADSVCAKMVILEGACGQLTSREGSKGLLSVLSMVLAVGNHLNGGSPRGQAEGVKLEVLNQIQNMKAAAPASSKNSTLLHFIADEIYSKVKDAKNFFQHWDSVRASVDISLRGLREEIFVLENQVKEARHELEYGVPYLSSEEISEPLATRLISFIESAEDRTMELKSQQDDVTQAVKELLLAYGENPDGDLDANGREPGQVLFLTITNFASAFLRALDDNEEARLEEERQKKKNDEALRKALMVAMSQTNTDNYQNNIITTTTTNLNGNDTTKEMITRTNTVDSHYMHSNGLDSHAFTAKKQSNDLFSQFRIAQTVSTEDMVQTFRYKMHTGARNKLNQHQDTDSRRSSVSDSGTEFSWK